MWKFKNPIKHPILPTRWPTAAEAAQSLLYQPINIGPLEARKPHLGAGDGALARD